MATSIAGAMDDMRSRVFGGGTMRRPRGLMAAMPPTALPPTGAPVMPSYKPRLADDSVTSNFNRITAAGSPLITMGQQTGLNIANRRGLLNSNIALGTAMAEGYKAALPLAQQDAQTNAAKNLASMSNAAEMERLRFSTGSQERMQGTDIAAQRERLQISNDAQMAQLERQLAGANEQQQTEIRAQMERLRATNAAELERLNRSGELDTAARTQQGMIQGTLQGQQNAAEMARLQASLSSANDQQKAEITAQMERLRVANEAEERRIAQQGTITGGLNQQQNAAEMARLQASMAGASEQQKVEIAARMDQLRLGAELDQGKMRLEGDIQKALQSSGAEQQRALASLQGDISSRLQAQQDAGQAARLASQFAHDLEVQKSDSDLKLKQIAATGDQEIRRLVEGGLQDRETLAMNIAAGDRERIAASMISIFNAETQLRGALLSNPQMPASERAAYERAIAGMGDPIRAYINALYSPPPAAGTPAPGTGAPAVNPVQPNPGGTGLVQNPGLGSYLNDGSVIPIPQTAPQFVDPAVLANAQAAQAGVVPNGAGMAANGALAERLRLLGYQ